jgi:hypothetical protein
MTVINTFSKRQQAEQSIETPFIFDELPEKLRVQIIHIWADAIGWEVASGDEDPWFTIERVTAREHGKLSLGDRGTPGWKCQNYVLTAGVFQAMDLVELSFRLLDLGLRNLPHARRYGWHEADVHIKELNTRFRENGVGYQYADHYFVRRDSEFMHSEAVVPAFSLLRAAGFEGPIEEFHTAHAHCRKGNYEDAIANAEKAFESTMKAICEARGWISDEEKEKLTAKHLIQRVFERQLLPPWLLSEFTALQSTLESGLPTTRNRQGGHGAGAEPREVPAYFAAYALHLAASNIVLLIEAHKDKK